MRRVRALLLGMLLGAPCAQAGLLSSIHEQALQEAPDWLAAQAAYQAVVASRPVARSGLMPKLGLDAGYGRVRDETHASGSPFIDQNTIYADVSAATLRLVQPLFDFQAWSQWDQYQQQEARALLDLRQVEQDLIIEITRRYLAWLEAGVALEFSNSHLKAMDKYLEQVSSRERLGLALRSDRMLVQAGRDSARAEVLAAAAALRATREAIRELLGNVPEIPVPLRDPIPLSEPLPADPEPWIEQSLRTNPEVAVAVIQKALAEEQLRERKSQRLPTLALEGRYGYTNTQDFQLGREWEDARLELRLAMPLYSGGAIRGNIAVSTRLLEQRDYELQAAQRKAERDVRDAYDGVVTGVVRVQAARQVLQSSEEARSAIHGRFESGLATLAEQLDADGQVRKARRDLAKVRHIYLMSKLHLAAAVGSLGQDDLQLIDQLLVEQP